MKKNIPVTSIMALLAAVMLCLPAPAMADLGDFLFKFPEAPTSADGGGFDSSGNFYFADHLEHKVYKYAPDGTFLMKWGERGTGVESLCIPTDVAVDYSDDVYVANLYCGIKVFTPDGQYLRSWSTPRESRSLDIGPDGNVYIAVGGSYYGGAGHKVLVFSPDGTLLREFGGYGTGDGQLMHPEDIAIDSSGNVYVSAYGDESINVFSSDGTFIRKWSSYGYLDVDSTGRVIVCNYYATKVFSGTGELLANWPRHYFSRVIVGPEDNVYFNRYTSVQVYTSDHQHIMTLGTDYWTEDNLYLPYGMEFGPDGNLYVADAGKRSVMVFTPEGEPLRKWSVLSHYRFNDLTDITLDADGNVYASSSRLGIVQAYTSDGTFIGSWGSPGTEDGQFNYIQGLETGPDGNIYTIDGSYRVQVFSTEGTFIRKWSTPIYPQSITVANDGTVYVAGNFNDIHAYSSDGTFLGSWGMDFPYWAGIKIDAGADGNIYVLEGSYWGVVEVHAPDGTLLDSFDVPPWNPYDPLNIAIVVSPDASRIYVGHYNLHNIQVYAGLAPADDIPPTITATVSPSANAVGWQNSDVTVTFVCDDAESGIAECPPPVVVSAEGAGQTVTGTAVDNAENSATASVVLSIDKTAPAATITGVQDGDTYALGLVPLADFTASDALSGLAGSYATLTDDDNLGIGTFTYTVTATDNAGNTATSSAVYEVIATPEGTAELIGNLITTGEITPQVEDALLAKLANGSDGALKAFINLVEAQAGKKITAEAAAVLINAADYVILNN
ncbi:MAG: hypothetical protein ABFS18_00205 [Thermodesulfobacteriota bacterium]